jgi:hypothetical protein
MGEWLELAGVGLIVAGSLVVVVETARWVAAVLAWWLDEGRW